MELRVVVRLDDLCITAADAVMHTFPHTECPGIAPAFAGLVGLSVARGYTRQVQSRFGGPRGSSDGVMENQMKMRPTVVPVNV